MVIAIVKKRYFTAIGVVVMGVFIFLYSAWTMVIVGLGEGHGDNFGKRHPIPEGMEYYTTKITPEYGNTSTKNPFVVFTFFI